MLFRNARLAPTNIQRGKPLELTSSWHGSKAVSTNEPVRRQNNRPRCAVLAGRTPRVELTQTAAMPGLMDGVHASPSVLPAYLAGPSRLSAKPATVFG
jgi:hypothetical protein